MRNFLVVFFVSCLVFDFTGCVSESGKRKLSAGQQDAYYHLDLSTGPDSQVSNFDEMAPDTGLPGDITWKSEESAPDVPRGEDIVCIPDCAGKECGPDGCGGNCGSCDPGKVCSQEGKCNPVPCLSSKDCPGDLVCDLDHGVCVDCLTDADCGDSGICGPDNTCVEIHQCQSDKDCKPWNGVCDKAAGYCVDCITNEDCLESEYCLSGFCVPDVCVALEMGCDGNIVAQCKPDGSGWDPVEECGENQYCEEGMCFDQICPPGEAFCDGTLLKVCDALGKSIISVFDCADLGLICVWGECQDLVCVPDEFFCVDDLTPAQCAADGLSFTVSEDLCGDGTYCEDGSCVEWKCVPGQPMCDGVFATVCDEIGKGPSPGGKDCSQEGKCCILGACVDPTAEECDTFDNDCDGIVDNGCDDDQDGWCDVGMHVVGTPPVCPSGPGDCDDANPDVNPGLPENPTDGIDNNCNKIVDEWWKCPGTCTGHSLEAYLCALEMCYAATPLSAEFVSPTNDNIDSAWEAVAHFGNPENDLAPKAGDSYCLLATGPATGTAHSTDLPGGGSSSDPFAKDSYNTFDNVEFQVTMLPPAGVTGFSVDFIFMSEEYEEWVGTSFDDKFYMIFEGPDGAKQVINFGACSNPASHFDFIDPATGEKRCYISINSAFSEKCPNAATNISGTGYECGPPDSSHGSSTGWLTTMWPVVPGEKFKLIFHIHDTSDGIFDSEVILDRFQWLYEPFTPGTYPTSG